MKGEYISIETSKIMADIEKENKKLHDRIDEAIEYIEQHRIGNEYSYEYDLFQRNARTSDLLEILKGE